MYLLKGLVDLKTHAPIALEVRDAFISSKKHLYQILFR